MPRPAPKLLPVRDDSNPYRYIHMTTVEIAKELGCTQQNVSLILKRAMKKMKAGLEAKGYTLECYMGDDV